ncbi:MAG: methyl-accepting chemotaxis protein [Oligoflexales bacterium]
MRKKILAAIVGVTILACFTLSVAEYFVEKKMLSEQLVEKAMLITKSFVPTALDAVSGGNVMLLQSRDAVLKYESYSNLLFMKVSGKSDGMEASSFSEAIPPTAVESAYISPTASPAVQQTLSSETSLRSADAEDGSYLDGDFLHVKSTLGTKNGGYLYAIYDVSDLASIGTSIATRNAMLNLGVIIASGIIGFWLTGQLASTISGEISTLEEISEKTKKVSKNMTHSASSISSFFSDQMRSMNDMTKSMQEIENTAQKTMAQAKECFEAVNNARRESDSGLRDLEAVSEAMTEIARSSADLREFQNNINLIRQKTGLINDIVFKTQLLSFNASIEASRAGQHGRGFAIVAGEVGQLAKMSGDAAAGINEIIEKTDRQIQKSLGQIDARVHRGEEVTKKTKGTFEIINREISVANQEVLATQTAVTNQLNLIQAITSSVGNVLVLLEDQQNNVQTNTKIAKEIDVLSSDLYNLGKKLGNIVTSNNRAMRIVATQFIEEESESLLTQSEAA